MRVCVCEGQYYLSTLISINILINMNKSLNVFIYVFVYVSTTIYLCMCVSVEEGEELRAGGDPHSVHELARPRRPRGATSPPETEAACQCFQEFLQWPHRRSLQVS